MIELGDILQGKQNTRFVGVATQADLDTVQIAQYERLYEDRIGSTKLSQELLRKRIRGGTYYKVGHAEKVEEATVTRHHESGEYSGTQSYVFDAEGVQTVYDSLDTDTYPTPLTAGATLYDTHQSRWLSVKEAGWHSDTLADDLVRLHTDEIESYTTVSQAIEKGFWLLMTTTGNTTMSDKRKAQQFK